MKITTLTTAAPRKLSIDFDAYTDGEPEFKNELINLIIANLTELKQSLKTAIHENHVTLFKKTCHKVNVTLQMLADAELDETIQELASGNSLFAEHAKTKSTAFYSLCESIIKSLEAEKN
jgi:hypothetical protein